MFAVCPAQRQVLPEIWFEHEFSQLGGYYVSKVYRVNLSNAKYYVLYYAVCLM